ncbi:MAG: Crp/Fnr family transcriptional regulator [Paracoccaceae bacterium]
MTLFGLIGVIGVAFYLGSYAALQLGYISGRGYLYPFCNLIGAAGVGVSIIEEWNLSSLIISVTYLVISVIGMTRTFLLRRTIKFPPDETRVIETILPGVDKIEAQKLIRIGRWIEAGDRHVLTQEGTPISNLIWVHSGRVSIRVGGRHVAALGEGAVLGEATCLTGAPATATVQVDGNARYFAVPVAPLRALVSKNAEIRSCLQDAISRQMRDKLHETNKRMVASQAAE